MRTQPASWEAMGNHDEETGQVASKLSAALILADKSDVHRTGEKAEKLVRTDW